MVKSLSYHRGFVAIEVEDRGLRWVSLYTDRMEHLWSSSEARYVEFNWSSQNSIAVRLCDGPCYNVNWQRVQVFDPSTGRSWNSSEARLVRFWWSPQGRLALVLWLSPCPDYTKHWMELYDPASDRSWRTGYRGFIYASWSPSDELAAVVRDGRGYHLEVLDRHLVRRWSSGPARAVDFGWSPEGRLVLRMELNDTQVLLLRDGDSVRALARGGEIHYAWSEKGDLVYSVDGEVRSLHFLRTQVTWLLMLAAGAILLILSWIRLRRSAELSGAPEANATGTM